MSGENEIAKNLPVIEVQYALDKMNPTWLFDCLIPTLKFSEEFKKRCHLPQSNEDAASRQIDFEWDLNQLQ